MTDRHPVYKHLEDFLPSFCWQSCYEVLIMLEGIDEDIEYASVKVALSRMSHGACPRIEKKAVPKRIGTRRPGETEYLYRFNPRFERERAPRRARFLSAKRPDKPWHIVA